MKFWVYIKGRRSDAVQKTQGFIKNIFKGKQQGNTLKKIRESRNLTQQQLADTIGVKYGSTICNYERNKRTPDLGTIRKLAEALEIPFKDLCDIFLRSKLTKRN
jgi:DNA-binding XRE family transcriptional regulator